MKKRRGPLAISILFVAACLTGGCEWDDDDVDHDPPAGQGSLMVDNRASRDINIFVDGQRVGEAKAFNDDIKDLDPGTYRVVLDEDSGNRYFADDLDIIEGKVTVWEVWESGSGYRVNRRLE